MSSYRPPPLDNYNSLPRNTQPSYGGGRRRQQGSRHGYGYGQRNQHTSHPLSSGPPGSASVIVNPFGSPDSFMMGTNDHQSHSLSADADSADRMVLNRPISAFVGGINSRVDDDWIKKILEKCGSLKTWKRALDIDDKPLSFGFCEFEDIKGAACAMRILGSSQSSQSKGWALPSGKTNSEPELLTFKIDNGLLRICESMNSKSDKDSTDTQANKDTSIRESVEGIIKELETYLKTRVEDADASDKERAENSESSESDGENADDKRSRLSKTVSDRNSRAGGRYSDNSSDEESDSSDDKRPFSLESEEKWEQSQSKRRRHERLVLAAEDYEYRLSKEQAERENRIERNALRELDRMEDRQRARDVMADILSKWDDSKEESLRDHEYYRDRERWWHHRKAARAKEIALDKEDREKEERERQAKADAAIDARSQHGASKNTAEISSSDPDQLVKDMSDASIKSPPARDDIPTDAEELFKWPVKWNLVDNALVQQVIEPATRKRLTEYLGADSDDGSIDDLAEFVVGHISEHKPPEELAQELEMVLVEESPVFVAHIWRILVEETERRARIA
ncbi:hypothetical protein H4R99_007666 [Coemansia sp. RSA 1722]|nr:hypothetical protein LPJ57_003363 [Coemansia sp. RSA 486]KAJ2223163.1 hypothetical protein IWW45_008413 [Coemansia sp. RSA 485]KAJ2588833.1 hypothetical protein H4R99_007666 [Coemansia sp. RSA 1722]